MSNNMKYPGIRSDVFGGMTDIGHIVRDAWVFGLISETETCQGWERSQIDDLYAKVHQAWEPHGHMVSCLPADLRERHERIYTEAVKQARELGWSPDIEDEG